MRLSRYPINTAKESPAEAEVISHKLMLRAGLIRRLAAGIYTFLPMGLRAARTIEATHGWKVRVVDLRWLLPLNEAAIARHVRECARVIVVDEGRRSAGVGEGIITAITEGGYAARPFRRVVGADTFTPLAGAAFLVDHALLLSLSLIWVAHIGADRALGYGLKYSSAFQDTHLGRIGRR